MGPAPDVRTCEHPLPEANPIHVLRTTSVSPSIHAMPGVAAMRAFPAACPAAVTVLFVALFLAVVPVAAQDATPANATRVTSGMPNDIATGEQAVTAGGVRLCRGETLPMTLDECIALVMRRNVNIHVAYLGRVLHKFDLVTDRDFAFVPDVALDASATHTGTDSDTSTHTDAVTGDSFSRSKSRSGTDAWAVTPGLSGSAPTGARYSASWGLQGSFAKSESRTDTGAKDGGWSPTRRDGLEKVLSLSLTQPLLKGAGIDYNTVSVKQAKLTERSNVLNLKRTIISQLTSAIQAYRDLLSQKWSVDISATSLQRAKDNLKLARIKVDIGRMAALDVVQYEADVANRELSLAQALNSYNTSRLALLQLLDMGRGTCIEPAETIDFEPMDLDDAKLKELVFETKPDYLTSLLGIKGNELTLLQARRDQLWDLSLGAGATVTDSESDTDTNISSAEAAGRNVNWNVGLTLNVPIFGPAERGVRRQLLSARSALHIARIQLRKQEEDILNDLEQRLSNIRLLERQVELSHRSRVLADKKVEVEKIKLEKGRSTTFQLVTFQDQQFEAQQSELSARIAYLNALAGLDSYLGTTMDTWGLEFKGYRPQAEDEIANARLDDVSGPDTQTRPGREGEATP